MKKALLLRPMATLLMLGFFIQGCVKDTCTRTYTILTPVYKTAEEVRANIKNDVPKPVSNPGKMFVLGQYIFLNEVDKGIHVIDNANPAKPVNKFFINIPGNIDLAVKGNILYADLYTDMVALDISDPGAVKVEKIIDDAFPFRRYANGFVANDSKIIVDWQKTEITVECDEAWRGDSNVLFFDSRMFNSMSSPAASAAKAAGVAGSMARFALYNDYLYTVTDNGLNVFNILQPAAPSLVNKVNIDWGIETIFPFKNNLFIGSSTGMYIYGTSNPLAPNRLSVFTHARVCDPVIADDNNAYVTLRSGTACGGFTNQLDVLNIENLSSPILVKTYPLTNPHGLSKYKQYLYVCDGADGLKVYDAANAASLKLLQTVKTPGTYDVITYNDLAMLVTNEGLFQYSIAPSGVLEFLSKISIQR